MRNFYSLLLDRLRALPGAERVGATRVLPTRGASWVPQIVLEGTVASSPRGIFVAHQIVVTPGYFEALGIRVLRQGLVPVCAGVLAGLGGAFAHGSPWCGPYSSVLISVRQCP